MGGNIYVNVVISAVAGLPAYPVSAFLTLRFERRKILLVSYLVAAVGAIGALLMSDKAAHDKGEAKFVNLSHSFATKHPYC